jgi:drug/metabolite transporter (DMT)-like permease
VNILGRYRIDLLLLAVAASWGSTYLVAKNLLSPSSVFALLAIRMLLAGALMVLVIVVRRSRVTRSELRAGLVLGVIFTGVFVFETFGIAHTSATNAGLIISLTMVFTPILESIVRRRRLPTQFFISAIVAVLGVALLAGNGAFQAFSLGDYLMLIAAIVRTIHVTVMHKMTSEKPMDSLHLTTIQISTAAVFFVIGSLFYGDSIVKYLSTFNTERLSLFLYLVLICTVFAFFVQTWAVRRTSPSRVSLLLGTEPVWAAVVGITLAHDRFGFIGYVGIGLVLVGTAWGRTVDDKRQRASELVAVAPPSAVTSA